MQDYGSTYGHGHRHASYTLYRAASGALVFGAGTADMPGRLDDDHDVTLSSIPDGQSGCSRQP